MTQPIWEHRHYTEHVDGDLAVMIDRLTTLIADYRRRHQRAHIERPDEHIDWRQYRRGIIEGLHIARDELDNLAQQQHDTTNPPTPP